MPHALDASRSTIGSLVFLLACAPLAAANGVRIADDPSLPLFTSLQAAVDAAPNGGLLLVQTGLYKAAVVDGKSLSIMAMPGAVPVVNDTLSIQNLVRGQTVVLSGITLQGSSGAGVALFHDSGSVRLQECSILGGKTFFSFHGEVGAAGVDAQSCTQVVISLCSITGGDAYVESGTSPLAGGSGISALDSAVAIYDTLVLGGQGAESSSPTGGDGGDACHLIGSGMFASGCEFRGGPAGIGLSTGCNGGGVGGDALDVTNASVRLLDDVTGAGAGEADPCGTPAVDGVTMRNSGSSVIQLGGTRRKLAAAAIAADDALLTVTVNGQPGDRFYLMSAWDTAFAYRSGWSGMWTIRPLTSAFARAIVPASGVLVMQVRMQDLVSLDHRLAILQGFCLDAAGQRTLTGPVQVELLDAAGGPDCDSSSVNDFVQLVQGATDCNGNVELDTCDIASGTSQDANQNGVPDECTGG